MFILVAFFLKAGVETVDSCRLGSGFFGALKSRCKVACIQSIRCFVHMAVLNKQKHTSWKIHQNS